MARTFNTVLATERPVDRFYGRLKLRVDKNSVDTYRMDLDQVPLLNNHNHDDVIGKVDKLILDSKSRVIGADVTMDDSDEAKKVERRIDNGMQTGVSPGIAVHKMKEIQVEDGETPLFEAERWEILELSSTAVPANPEAHINLSYFEKGGNSGDRLTGMVVYDEMAYNQAKAQGTKTRRDKDMGDELTLEDMQKRVDELEVKLKDAGTATPPSDPPAPAPASAPTSVANLEMETRVKELEAKLAAKVDPPSDPPKDTGEQEKMRKMGDRVAILELGAKYGKLDEASKHEGDLDTFRDKLLSIQFQPNPVSRQPGINDIQKFDMGRLIQHLADPINRDVERHAAYEIKCIREHDLQSKVPNGALSGGAIIPMEKLAVTTSTIDGSVQTDVDLGRAYQFLVDQAMIAKYCTIIPGLTGNLEFPVSVGGVTVGYNAEGALQAESTPTYGKVSLSPKSLSAKTTLTRLSVLQTGGWLDGFVRETIGLQFGEQMDTGILIGTGSNDQVRGILNQTGLSTVTNYGSSLAWSTFTGMQQKVREGKHMDKGGRIYVMTPAVFNLAQIKPKDTGSGLFIIEPGSIVTQGQFAGDRTPWTVDGYPAIPSTLMPADQVLFGEFKDVHVGMWDGLIIRVDDVTDATNFKISAAQFWDIDIPRAAAFVTADKA